MMEKNTKFSPPAVGGSSLLAIFAVLTLCVFALLSLSTVLAEKRLSDAAADSVERYYAADLQAEEILARLKNGEIPEEVTEENGTYRCTFSISQNQHLIAEFKNTHGEWQILRWQVIARSPELKDDSLPVWEGKKP